ncbi:hypothetical protein [Leifsonia poae]|uniref:hypothetical protein n=1 Tax=Leifsonia poae TaxID=110933 RepID=UPI001CBE2AFA|nr:hypothetical protein [Leifsonia poae]
MEEEPGPDLDALERAWFRERDGETGYAYGDALLAAGRDREAEAVFRALIDDDYLSGYYALGWLETERGNHERGQELLQNYLDADTHPDEFTEHVAGVLGHWLWHYSNRPDAEGLLRRGAEHFPSARTDLGHLLRITDREAEAEAVLRGGVAVGEVDSFLPLAKLLDESGRTHEAEMLYREGFDRGDAFAAYNLHLLLLRENRAEEASDWLWAAAQGGDELAIRTLADDVP